MSHQSAVQFETESRIHSSQGDCCPNIPAIMEAVQRGDMPAAAQAFENAGGMAACSCLVGSANNS